MATRIGVLQSCDRLTQVAVDIRGKPSLFVQVVGVFVGVSARRNILLLEKSAAYRASSTDARGASSLRGSAEMLLRTLVFIGALLGAAASPALASDTQVFQLPNGAFPHDVAPAPDGKVWYSAQRNGALGILDPVTGQSREVKLGPNSAPHGVIQGPDGAAWLTDGGQNAIARVDPKSEEVKVWKLPAEFRPCQPEHRHVRPRRRLLVHRAERHLRPARPADG